MVFTSFGYKVYVIIFTYENVKSEIICVINTTLQRRANLEYCKLFNNFIKNNSKWFFILKAKTLKAEINVTKRSKINLTIDTLNNLQIFKKILAWVSYINYQTKVGYFYMNFIIVEMRTYSFNLVAKLYIWRLRIKKNVIFSQRILYLFNINVNSSWLNAIPLKELWSNINFLYLLVKMRAFFIHKSKWIK